jgi:hypothetical protein
VEITLCDAGALQAVGSMPLTRDSEAVMALRVDG